MNYFWAFFGSFIYNLLLFVRAKDNCDKADVPFQYAKYFWMNWDNWLVTACLAPILVAFMPEIVSLLNDKLGLTMEANKLIYLGAGPLTEAALFGISKLLGWKESWVAPVHKE